MLTARAVRLHRGCVAWSDVSDMRREPITRVHRVDPSHESIARDLGDDGGCRNRSALRIAVDYSSMRWCKGPEPEPVHEARFGGIEIIEHRTEAPQVGAMETFAIDARGWDHSNSDLRGSREHGMKQQLSLLGFDLLRVVETGKRSNPSAAQGRVVEHHSGHDERTGKGSPTSLVGPGYEPDAELAIKA
jgi:hypothetical protein